MQIESTTITKGVDIAWGARAIGQELGLTERQAYHRLEQGQIACAKKFGATWAASRTALRKMFGLDVA